VVVVASHPCLEVAVASHPYLEVAVASHPCLEVVVASHPCLEVAVAFHRHPVAPEEVASQEVQVAFRVGGVASLFLHHSWQTLL
jgi:hypothetical protein